MNFSWIVNLDSKKKEKGSMSESTVLDFKPRARGLVVGDIPWLARISDKARAHLEGRIGDYIYPCGADQKFLDQIKMNGEEFKKLVAECPDDDALIERMRKILAERNIELERELLFGRVKEG